MFICQELKAAGAHLKDIEQFFQDQLTQDTHLNFYQSCCLGITTKKKEGRSK